MTNPPSLFAGNDLLDKLQGLREKAHRRLVDWQPDGFLSTPEADAITCLLDLASIVCPTLQRDDAYLIDPDEVTQSFREFGEVGTRRVTRLTLVVPFDGDPEIFKLKPSSSTWNPPHAQVSGTELRVFAYPPGRTAGLDAIAVRADFDAKVDAIGRYLAWSRHDIDAHQRVLGEEIPRMVADRRTKLLADRELQASLGFPIKRRRDADLYSVPLRRRQVIPRDGATKRAPAQGYEPEPSLPDEDYEAALAVLRNMRNALERSPSTTGHLGEEQIRDLLLVSLNAQFEGKAAGEVFNGAGKTDILIRVDDRNIFIGECKIWKGPKTVTDALDQLVGYLVWRDTKAALLLFIREADVSTIAAKAITKVEEHPGYKRRGKNWTEDRYDFVLRTPGDSAREIHLALLPFVIGAKGQHAAPPGM